MIIFVNCKITDIKRPGTPDYKRSNLRNGGRFDRFDIARYCFASFAPLAPLVSKFIFYLDVTDGFAGRQGEMEQWLRSVLPEDKLSLHWHRCNTIQQWREANEEFKTIDDDLIYPVGNDDHAFLDSDINVFARGLELVKQDTNPYAVMANSHFPEFMRYAALHHGTLTECGNYVVYEDLNFDALRVMKREYFEWHLTAFDDDRLAFRTEHWFGLPNYPRSKIYAPTKEQFRHFDGYGHVNIGPDVVSPLEIPLGFFERSIKIRYGFDDIDPTATNINPLFKDLRSVDPINGIDYKFTLEDIPVFWKPFIKEINVAPNFNHRQLSNARNQHYLDSISIDFNQYDSSTRTPHQWISRHLI